MRVCAAEQGMVFKPGGALPYLAYEGMCCWTGYGFQGLSLKQGIQFHEQGVFLDKPFKECEHLRWAAYICNTDIFFLNYHFHDFSEKNYLVL